MRLDFGVNKLGTVEGVPLEVKILGMRGRKHALQREPWDEFKNHLRDLRGVPTHWSVNDKNEILVWPTPNMAIHVEVTMGDAPQAEPEILPPLPPVKVKRVAERRA